jgi:hypothetical protein
VDAILRDDALLDALGRGELPAAYRADVTARLITGWRLDIEEPSIAETPTLALTALTGGQSVLPPRLAERPRDAGDTAVLSGRPDPGATDPGVSRAARFGEEPTADLPRYRDDFRAGLQDDDVTASIPVYRGSEDRIDESFRSAFVAAGYARPSGEERTEEFSTFAEPEGETPSERPRRHGRRRLDRLVVAAAAAAAVLAAGSAGSVAAASTAHPGDKLWPISKVLYADRAHSIEAGEDAHTALKKAREAAARGDTAAARKYLAQAKQKAGEVREGSDEADALEQDMATMDVLTNQLSPSPDAGGTDSASASTGTPTDSKSRQQQRGHGGKKWTSTSPTVPPVAPSAPNGSSSGGSHNGNGTGNGTSNPPASGDPTTTGPTDPGSGESSPTTPTDPSSGTTTTGADDNGTTITSDQQTGAAQ